MKAYLLASLVIGLVSGGSVRNYAAHGVGSDYGSENYGKDDYGRHSGGSGYEDKKCYPTYETKYKEKCVDYFEKVCYTKQEEKCSDVESRKCKAIPSLKQERKCFDVTELLCSLKENIQYEEVPAVFTVQKCHKVTERVCDTAYETKVTEKDDFKCISIVNPWCSTKDYKVYDKTCRTVTHFDCKPSYGYGPEAVHGDYDSYGKSKGYAGKDVGAYDQSYGQAHKCKRTTSTKCYTSPRAVSSQYCEDRTEKVCEKLTERVPMPEEKQVCHDEQKKVCELEERSQPKQLKKYVYTKACTPVYKQVCGSMDYKSLKPTCVAATRKDCSYYPSETCEKVPKQHCYKMPYKVKKMVCHKGYESSYKSKDYGAGDGSYESYRKPQSLGAVIAGAVAGLIARSGDRTIPETMNMPDDVQVMPDDTEGMADDIQGMPDVQDGMPDDMQVMPDDMQVMPDDMPDDMQVMPDDMQAMPGDAQGMPADTS